MKKFLLTALMAAMSLFGQITSTGTGTQAVTLTTPQKVPITCGAPSNSVVCTASAVLTGSIPGPIALGFTGNESVTLSSQMPVTCSAPAVTVTCTAPPPTITLPIEVFGPGGTITSQQFYLASVPTGTLQLFLQIHGLRYQTEASFQVNGSSWTPLNSTTTTLQGPALAYGGIGGGFATLSLTVPIPAGALVTGTNTLNFQFVASDGISSEYRVLAFNIQSAGANLIPATTFVQQNPATWTPPLTDAADIAAGQTLWTTAALTDTASGVTTKITAHCSDCHAADGRDLKYFNYSNASIIYRAAFHGLSAQQGAQLASFIRSLPYPAPGLPWNPPYQPGPGMDTVPVASWSAGAGLAAVLPNDAAMAPYITNMAATAYLNPRTTPLPLQFPDWNNWLPKIWPGDGYGAAFTAPTIANQNPLLYYQQLRTELTPAPTTAKAYFSSTENAFTNIFENESRFLQTINLAPTASTNWVAEASVQQWLLVKQWEINQDFGLESNAAAIYGTKANNRAWFGQTAFNMEFSELHIPRTGAILNGTLAAWEYGDNIWNFVQLALNDGQGNIQGPSPIDFAYVQADVKDLSLDAGNMPLAYTELVMRIKALQGYTLNGKDPSVAFLGFSPNVVNLEGLVDSGFASIWTGYSAALRTQLTTQYAQAWYNQMNTYTPAMFYAGKDGNGRPWATTTEVCNDKTTDSIDTFGGQMWFTMPRLRALGVPASVLTPIYTMLEKIFPATNWTPNTTATCNVGLGSCTGDDL
jgi:cytochrome c553